MHICSSVASGMVNEDVVPDKVSDQLIISASPSTRHFGSKSEDSAFGSVGKIGDRIHLRVPHLS